jgi:AraC-like DNA-binding protein
MSATTRKSPENYNSEAGNKGLFRAMLAGPGHSLSDAFANLEGAQHVERLSRHTKRNLIGARITLAPEEGEGYWELTKIGDDVFIVVENFAYKDPRIEFVPGDGLVQFYFKLSGDLTMAVGRTEPLRLNRPSLLVYNQPTGVDIREWTAPSARERCVQIGVRPQFLIDTFLTSIADAPPQLQAYVDGTPGRLQYCQLPLNAQMFELATKLVNNPYSGALGLVHAEAVTLELLCTAIAGFTTLAGLPAEEYSQRELRCLHAARGVLMKQLSPAPTIRQVARVVGINETTLKRGFKAVFGETIFYFSVRCRMQHALALLREQRMPVARVAEAVGYRHQTSFATAFRRHFGLRPKDVRRSERTS